jgi:protein-disulfide isomerase
VPPNQPASSQLDEDAPPERSRRLLVVLGVLGAVSAVIAALVIFSSGESTTRPADPVAPRRVSGQALVVGKPDAPRKVVVFEDFASAQSREFEIASRDFLRVEAADGGVVVEYRPFHLTDGYSRDALEAWAAVAEHGTPAQALAFHDLLFDRQPRAGGTAAGGTQFESWAVEAGVDQGMVSEALLRPDASFVEAARHAARSAGIEITPTILVDGKPFNLEPGVDLADEVQRTILED